MCIATYFFSFFFHLIDFALIFQEGVPMRNEQVDVISSVMNVIEVELYMFLGILVYSCKFDLFIFILFLPCSSLLFLHFCHQEPWKLG